jgi:aminopeptidase N
MKKIILYATMVLVTSLLAETLLSQQFIFSDNTALIAESESHRYTCCHAHHHRHSRAGANIDVVFTRFEWEVDPAVRYIKGGIFTAFRTLEDVSSIILELNDNMIIDSIVFRAKPVSFSFISGFEFSIDLNEVIEQNTLDSIAVYYQGEPITDSGFGSFVQDEHNEVPIIWTLSQPYGAKDWWPGKNDLTDKIDSIDVVIKTPAPYRAVSHGVQVNEIFDGDHIVYHFRHRYPIVSYLVAFAVTNYVTFTNWAVLRGDSIPIIEYVYPEDSASIFAQSANTFEILQLFDTLFTPYPFGSEIYGHAQFSRPGGMEHQTMSFMGTYTHDIRSHELAHSWFGNKITLSSWHHIWLNEGFATYSTGLSYEHMYEGKYWQHWKQLARDFIVSKTDGSVYVEDTTSVARIFDPRLSYFKGAYLLHQIRWIIGDEAFYAALRNYLNDPMLEYRFATLDDIKSHFELAAGQDLTAFFQQWYYGEGYPIYGIQITTLTDSDKLLITIHQEQSHPSVEFFNIPVPMRFYGEGQEFDIVCNPSYSGEQFVTDYPGFSIDSANFDPDIWLIAQLDYLSLGLPDHQNQNNNFIIYPNPVNNQIEFLIADKWIKRVEIFNITGQRILAKPVSSINETVRLNVSDLGKGIYFLRVETDQGNYDGKFVK